MTEKRFMLDDAGELIDKETAQFIEYGEKVCDLLNEQHEEIQRLLVIIADLETISDNCKHKNRELEEQLRNLRRLANEIYMEGSE